jgi:hypothetical protein
VIFQAAARDDEDDSAWVVCDKKGRVARIFAGGADGQAALSVIGAVAFGRRCGEIWYSPGGAVAASRLLGGDGRFYSEPAWSPDGAQLAFRVSDGPQSPGRLSLLDVYAGVRAQVPSTPGRSDGHPAFASDGSLYFDSVEAGVASVYRLFDDGHIERVTLGRHPAPLGDELVVVARAEGLWLVDGAQKRELELSLPADAAEPARASTKDQPRLGFTAGRADNPDAPARREVLCAKIRYKRQKRADAPMAVVDEASQA